MPPEDPQALGVLEALHSTPARRYLSTEPIGDVVVQALLDAAIRGPSGGNSQQWAWIVVRDPDVKARIAEWYREAWEKHYGSRREQFRTAGTSGDGMSAAAFRAADHLAAHLEEAPVWIFPVLAGADNVVRPGHGLTDRQNKILGRSAFPACVQSAR